MAQDLINEAGVYPVNSNGEIVLQSGTGNNTVVGYINSSQVPTDVSTNKMVVKMPVDVPQLVIDSSNSVSGISYNSTGASIERRPEWKKKNYFKKRFTVVDDMAAAVSGTSGWTRFAGTSVLENSPTNALTNLYCNNTLKISNMGDFERVQRQLKTPTTLTGTTYLWVYISQMPVDFSTIPPVYRGCDLTMVFGDSTFAVNTASFTFTSGQFLRSGWNCLMINSTDTGTLNTTGNAIVYAGSAPGNAATSYTHMRLTFSNFGPYAGITPVVQVGGVFQNGSGRANILMNFDDGHQDSIDLVNLFKQYEIPVGIAVVTGSVGKGAYMTEQQLRDFYNSGVDLFPHTTDHVVLDTIPIAVAKANMKAARDWCIERGFVRTSDVMAYPTNQSNDQLFAAAKDIGYKLGRWSKPGWLPTAQGIDAPQSIGSRDLGGKTLAQAKLILDSAETYGCTQVIYAHQIAVKTIQSMTYSGGVVTVNSTAHGYSNGHLVNHRGADQPSFNVAGIVENVTTNSYTFKAVASQATATSSAGMRSFSPDFPAAGSTPPASRVFWNWSDYVAFAQELSDRITNGTLSAISYSDLLDNCRV